MLSIFLLFLFSLPSGLYAQTAERPLKVVVEAGRNVTLPHLSGSHQTGHVTWLVETSDYGSASPDNFIFSGQKLCQFTDRTMVWPYYNLHFNCENYDLNLFWLKVENSAIYNVKNTVNASETNIYYDLRVVQIFPPKCIITSKYLTNDYCHITINCTNSDYPNKVVFNNVSRWYYGYGKGSPTLPNYFITNFNVSGITKSFNHTYPFNELCDYPTSQSQHSLTHTVSTVIFLGIIGFSILIIIAAFIYLCWHRKSLCVSKTEPLMPIPY
ncbi:membrane glycoprotein E3 CR1-beta [Human adenovirus 12]|nr:membrane glycoprotein E3 CR1-beta [Human adenovirus 12]WOZ23720.1 membrane glycoprotein E3 CR1-beta [Human adenovirus 12]WOZ24624.1 membrane glycoprotein E3 CR1-beta [Human adenovirus 12]WRT27622.1 membrane glycoprotein E3 CR1-beta [Human adenovirus 12]WRT27657.1 membrane glycoprotein E3 CR1-beta [Human adenovirus 12]